MKTIYLLDISSFFFRSYYALPTHMANPKGLPTNALYGVTSMLVQLIKKNKPHYIVCCFDTKTPSFRKDLFPDYKSNRGDMPDDLVLQVPYLKKLIQYFGIQGLEKEGYEADDLIGSFASFSRKKGLKTMIVSGDKDFAQLVDSQTFLLDTMKSKTYDAKGVKEKWGVAPKQMLDYLSIVGDVSDNIPGVKGIGPKGAIKLLEKYKSLDGIYKHIDEIKDHRQAKLKENKEQAYLSKKLITIVTDIPLEYNLKELELKVDKENLKKLFEDLGFKTFLQTLFPQTASFSKKETAPSPKASSKNWTFQDFKKNIKPYDSVWTWQEGEHFFLSCNNHVFSLKEDLCQKLGPLFDDKCVRYQGYDLKTCWKKLKCKNPLPQWDLMLASHLLDSKISNSFFILCQKYIGKEDFSSPEESFQAHKALQKLLMDKLKKSRLQEVYESLELPLIPVLYAMEQKGLLLDQKEIKKQSQALKKDLQSLQKKIHSFAGEEFNISSPKQLSFILFEKMKLPIGRKTKTGYSTDSHVLTKMKEKHPILPLLLEYRELFKLQTTYVDALSSLVDSQTKRIHTEFRQTVTSTGRLSSVQPNLQNIPIRTDRGRQVRKAFVAPPQSLLISADYSQIELRVLAHFTEDPPLIQAFKEDLDIHTLTASEVFNVPLEKVTPDLRRRSKAINFGIIYGQGPYGLAESLGISRIEGKEIISNYFKKFKKVKDYMEAIVEQAQKQGYVETLFGRKRFFAENDFKSSLKGGMERAAINAPIQGTASDLVKKAMIKLDESLFVPILCQVHDELLFECPLEKQEEEVPCIVSIMEQVVDLKIPLKVNVVSGQDWFSAHA